MYMPLLGAIIPNSVVGVGRLERASKRESQRKSEESHVAPDRAGDDAELSTQAVDESRGLRSAKGNTSEESREDRAEHTPYGPASNPQSELGELDIEV